jgi:hypothetical protein
MSSGMKINTKIYLGLGIIALFVVVMFGIQIVYNPPQSAGASTANTTRLDETFDKSDFTYGPMAWKPYSTRTLPIVSGHDPTGNDNFYVMFVDLYATPFGIDNLSNYTGGIQVNYSFTGLTGLAAFNVYGFAMHSNNLGNTPGVFMTNRVDGASSSGFYVYGNASLPGSAPAARSLGLNMIKVRVANEAGPAFDVYGDGNYSITFIQPGGGLNALHFTTSADSNKRKDFGLVTFTHDQSGTFYISDTGGAGISDVLLMVAVNATIPDNFALHLNASMKNRSVFG